MNNIMYINRACKNFNICYTYHMKVSDNLTGYERPFLLLGCPSMNENPSDCKFYKEILKFDKMRKILGD